MTKVVVTNGCVVMFGTRFLIWRSKTATNLLCSVTNVATQDVKFLPKMVTKRLSDTLKSVVPVCHSHGLRSRRRIVQFFIARRVQPNILVVVQIIIMSF